MQLPPLQIHYLRKVYEPSTLAPAGIVFGGNRGPSREGLEGGRRVGGPGGGAEHPGRRRSFHNFFKSYEKFTNLRQNLKFLRILMEIFAIFSNIN